MLVLFLAGCVGLQSVPPGSGPPSADPFTVGGVEVSASAVDFGSVAVGSSAEETLVLTNGSGSLAHVSAELTGEGFSADAEGFDLMKDGEQVVTFTFAPEDVGQYDGRYSLVIGEESAQVPLSGEGTDGGGDTGSGDTGSDTASGDAGELSTDHPSLDFGSLDLYASTMMQLTVTNTGSGPLTVSSATSSDGAFTLGGNLTPPRTLDPGEDRVVEITFMPTSAKTYNATLTLESDDPASKKTQIALTGKGQDLCDVCSPLITVSTGSASDYAITDFNSFMGSTDTRTITIGNDGDQDLDVSSVTVKNDFIATCGDFSLGGWKGAKSIAPGDTTTFTISYKATSAPCVELAQKSLDANVAHIFSNDPAEPDYVIELSGGALF